MVNLKCRTPIPKAQVLYFQISPNRFRANLDTSDFDTNIYSYIHEKNECVAVLRTLQDFDCAVVASAGNLFEIYAIADESKRRSEVEVLVNVADEFEDRPASWYHSRELRYAIRRHRSQWLKLSVRTNQIEHFLDGHQALWKEACAGILPPSDAYSEYRRSFESGVAQKMQAQKVFRRLGVNGNGQISLFRPNETSAPISLDNPETYWRGESLSVWYQAIARASPVSRDYADWLGPYLTPLAFDDGSYHDFWMRDVTADELPYNRLLGLVGYYQLSEKIQHGNAGDQIHAGHWFETDAFLTADRAFWRLLRQIATHHYPHRHPPILIERGKPSFAAQLRDFLSRTCERKLKD
jgi:hypothetical protein